MNTKLLSTSRLAMIAPMTTAQAKARMDVQAFHNAMRQIWQDHLTWTRFVIISVFEELPDLDPTVQRLLQNREDIGDAIKPFDGDAAGVQLTTLFREHILIAAEIFQATKSSGTAPQNDAIKRWYANADDIALFLNAANPKYWPLEEVTVRMREHLDLTLKEAVAYFGGNYNVSMAAYDEVHLQALEIADMLSMGIIRQFPDEFMVGTKN
jgi:hypothetical protein